MDYCSGGNLLLDMALVAFHRPVGLLVTPFALIIRPARLTAGEGAPRDARPRGGLGGRHGDTGPAPAGLLLRLALIVYLLTISINNDRSLSRPGEQFAKSMQGLAV